LQDHPQNISKSYGSTSGTFSSTITIKVLVYKKKTNK
jgi:hypothetical protein